MIEEYAVEVQIDDAYVQEVDEAEICAVVTATLRHVGVSSGSVTVVITDDLSVQRLNQAYRGIDGATDVLSFPGQAELGTDVRLVLPSELVAEMASYWGDIVIAYPYATSQAQRFGNSQAAELRLLVVHGVLHLLGYDHDTPHREAEMWSLQEAVLARFGDSVSGRVYD